MTAAFGSTSGLTRVTTRTTVDDTHAAMRTGCLRAKSLSFFNYFSFDWFVWDVDDFNDVVIWLGWVIAANAVSNLFHYDFLNATK